MEASLGSYTVKRTIECVVRIEVLSNSPMVEMTRRKHKLGMLDM